MAFLVETNSLYIVLTIGNLHDLATPKRLLNDLEKEHLCNWLFLHSTREYKLKSTFKRLSTIFNLPMPRRNIIQHSLLPVKQIEIEFPG